MSELKYYKLFHRASALTSPNFISVVEFGKGEEVCLKSEVDAAIAELKAKLESEKASHYAESVDAGMENRRLKRALWLARADRASDKAKIFYFAETCGVELNIDGFSNKEKGHARMRPARWWRLTWLKVERKCRAESEKYK